MLRPDCGGPGVPARFVCALKPISQAWHRPREINQPLTAIQNYAQAARRGIQSHVNQTPKVNELLDKIEGQASRAGDIIQSIRNLISTDSAALSPRPLYPIGEQEVLQVIKPEIEAHACRIDDRPAPGLPPVLADSLPIQLVLVNLLQNALHALESIEDKAKKAITVDAIAIS